MKRETAIAIAVAAALLLGGVAVVVLSRKQFLDLVAGEVRRQLDELRPDLSDHTPL